MTYVLIPQTGRLYQADCFDALPAWPDDFMSNDRDDTPPQDREAFC